MAAAHTWTADTLNLFSASRWNGTSQAWLYLVVEAVPGGGWDWAVWPSDNSGRSLAGTAGDRADATRQAEQAAAWIGRVRVMAAV